MKHSRVKRRALGVLCAGLVLVATVGCRGGKDPSKDDAPYTNAAFPSLAVESVSASPGQPVTVGVALSGNPGFLTMAVEIEYDTQALQLQSVQNGSDYGEYQFIGPKNRNSPCTAAWFKTDPPEKIVDGLLLQLCFSVRPNAEKGSYAVKVSRAQNGGAVTADKTEIVLNNAIGYVEVT